MELSEQYKHDGYEYFLHGDDDHLMRQKLGEYPEAWRDGAFHVVEMLPRGGMIVSKEDVERITKSSLILESDK